MNPTTPHAHPDAALPHTPPPPPHTPLHPPPPLAQALEDHDTLYELCETWQQQEQQRWTSAELQRRRARLALDYPGDAEEELFGDQVSMIYGATTSKPGVKVRPWV
jgi:hypothetical protein